MTGDHDVLIAVVMIIVCTVWLGWFIITEFARDLRAKCADGHHAKPNAEGYCPRCGWLVKRGARP